METDLNKVIHLRYSGQVCYIEFNRPEKLNALSQDLLASLKEALEEAAGNTVAKVIVLTGKGRAFVAGADINEFLDIQTKEEAVQYSQNGQRIFNLIEEINKPVIAAINGFALGGGLELALACDFRVASEEARVGLPEIKLGLYPGYGGAQRLLRLVGQGKAMLLMMTGKTLSASEAERLGVVELLFPKSEFKEKVEELAQTISNYPAESLASLKNSVIEGEDMELKDALKLDSQRVGHLMITEEAKARAKAFTN